MTRGASAIEWLVCIAIIAILAAIVSGVLADDRRSRLQNDSRLERGIIEVQKIIAHPTDSREIDTQRLRDALRRVQGR